MFLILHIVFCASLPPTPGFKCSWVGVSSSHVWMWELDYKESWAPKNWCFWNVVLEKTVESPLDARRSNQSILKESVLNIHWKDWCWSWGSNTLATWCEKIEEPDAGKVWRPEKGMTEDERVGWHHQLNGHEFWVNSRSWWWTGSPGVLQSVGSQRVRHNWLNWPEWEWYHPQQPEQLQHYVMIWK